MTKLTTYITLNNKAKKCLYNFNVEDKHRQKGIAEFVNIKWNVGMQTKMRCS